MKKIKKKIQKLRKVIIGVVLLLPLIFGSFYLGFYLGVLVPDLTKFMEIPPDTDEFYPLEDINLSRLDEIGNKFEILQERHIPINLSQTIRINSSTREIIQYDGTDNGALHTAEALTASCFRYASSTDDQEKNHALGLIRKMLHGLQMLIEVPNGGLGPDFPGTSIGRFYVSPAQRTDGNYTWMFDEYFRHFNGTGKYSNWRIRLYTSKDELAGYFLGIASTLMLIQDVSDVQNITKLIILQAMEGFLSSFWQEMSGDGKPNGVHLQVPCYSQWKLLLTKMATIVDPENLRYEQLYQYYLVKERKINKTPNVGAMDNIDNYYSQYFENMVVLGLFLVEKDQKLVDLYFKNYQSTYQNYRGHRNAFLNALYLGAASLSNNYPDFNVDEIRWDILDQLWRFNVFDLIPYDSTFGGLNHTINRTTKSEKFGNENWLEIDPNIAKWKNFVDNKAFGKSYQWLTYGLQDAIFRDRYLKPATIEMSSPSTIIWNRNPYQEDGNNEFNNENIITEYHGASFSLPYYMLKYFGYIELGDG